MPYAERTNPELWEKLKNQVKQGSEGGRQGFWSPDKVQMVIQRYREAGGGYVEKAERDRDQKIEDLKMH